MKIIGRLRSVFRRDRMERELDEELRGHIEMRVEENIRAGMSPEEARYDAQRRFGNTMSLKDRTRDVRRIGWLETTLQDLRYGARMLRKNPGFTAIAVFTLALGIGANTAIFSIVNAVFLRPLPFADAGRILLVHRAKNQIGGATISLPMYLAWKERQELFDSFGLINYAGDVTLTQAGEPERLPAMEVSSGFFSVLAVQPAKGRIFRAEETQAGGAKVVMLSDALWRSRFGADPAILERVLTLNGKPYQVIGVLPAQFEVPLIGARDTQLWLPYPVPSTSQNSSYGVFCLGRLRNGVSPAQAEAALTPTLLELSRQFPKMVGASETAYLQPLGEFLHERAGNAPLLLLGAVGLVLILSCANVGSLLIERGTVRSKEIAIRTAIGAGRARIVRQLVTESVLLGLAGGAAGVFACYASFDAILTLVPGGLPRIGAITMDATVLAFALALSIVSGLLFGLVPAWGASKTELQSALKEGTSRGSSRAERGKLHGVLITAEIGLSMVLLVGAALLLQSFSKLLSVQPGFDASHVLTFRVPAPRTNDPTSAQAMTYFRDFAGRLASWAEVEEVSYANMAPYQGQLDLLFSIEGRPESEEGEGHDANYRIVSPEYFRALRIPVLRGRGFTDADAAGAEPVVVINRAMAQAFWGAGDPLGEHIWIGKPMGPASTEPAPRRIVGIVADIRDSSLDAPPAATMYVPFAQRSGRPSGATYLVRTRREPLALVSAVHGALREAAPDEPAGAIRSLDQLISRSLTTPRFNTTLLSLFGAMALLIVALGVYGVMSYFVARRTHEIGVRLALGATPRTVLGMVLKQGLRLAGAGIVLGLAASLALSGLLRSMLFGVQPTSPVAFVSVTLFQLGVALAACWIPARRAARVDPMVALRYE